MTIEEKLTTKVSINTQGEAIRFANESVKVAEDFAIGFMKWFYENAYLIEWLSNDHNREQLLKAYKKTL